MTEQTIQRTKKKEKPKCPDCGSTRTYKDGFRKAPLCDPTGKPIQRYRCADYGHRFSKHFQRQIIKAKSVIKQTSQIHVIQKEAKKLTSTQEIKTCAELIKHTPSENEIRATPQIEKLLTH